MTETIRVDLPLSYVEWVVSGRGGNGIPDIELVDAACADALQRYDSEIMKQYFRNEKASNARE